MSRFLFVVPPLTGHVNPTVDVGPVRLRAGELHDAVRAVLAEPGYRAAAGQIRDSFTAAGGAAAAACHLEKLL